MARVDFPKSLDVSKSLDKAAGEQRPRMRGVRSGVVRGIYAQDAWSKEFKDSVLDGTPLTAAAKQWQGWGTALKPAYEPVIWAFKDLRATAEWCNLVAWLDATVVRLVGTLVSMDMSLSSSLQAGGALSIASLWSACLAAVYSDVSTSTTAMAERTITALRTLKSSLSEIMPDDTIPVVCPRHGTKPSVSDVAGHSSGGFPNASTFPTATEHVSEKQGSDLDDISVKNADECSTALMCEVNGGLGSVLCRAQPLPEGVGAASELRSSAVGVDEALKSMLRGLVSFGIAAEPAWPLLTVARPLAPRYEPIILARAPLSERNVAANVLRWGTGALNIDECRIATQEMASRNHNGRTYDGVAEGYKRPNASMYQHKTDWQMPPLGRWPANVALDEEAALLLDEQSGQLSSNSGVPFRRNDVGYHGGCEPVEADGYYGDTGGASRFFYCAKVDRSERNIGLDGMPERPLHWSSGHQNPGSFQAAGTKKIAANDHPTVKPVELMRWLCRLITPPGGIILDPFCGSGSTGIAALREGFSFIGLEQDEHSIEIARRRIVGDAPLFNLAAGGGV